MASENLFEDDFSEEISTNLNQVNPCGLEDSSESNQESKILENHTSKEIAEGFLASNAEDEDHQDNKNKLFQLPLARVRNLMKLDPDLHIASNEAVFVVTRATEEFVESLARESYFYTAQAKKKTVQKRDVDLAIAAVDSLMFLEGAMF